MFPEAAAWLIIGLPLVAAVLIAAVIRPFAHGAWRYSGYVAIAGIGGAFVLSMWALVSLIQTGAPDYPAHLWFTVGDPGTVQGFALRLGILLDPLTAIMVVVVSGVSLLVQVYSLGYMRKAPVGSAPEVGHVHASPAAHETGHGEGHTLTPVPEDEWSDYPRYFTYMSIFTASMLGLVLSYNLIQLFVFWELVGLSSYLLIGFWYHRPAAAVAAKKAFVVTRVGDFGFLLALLYLFFQRESFVAAGLDPFAIPDILQHAAALPASVATWIALGIFAGAVGKSAQFPLNTWLPDAMEGPTPVSSLIHAATMVAAGVFLVARMFPLFAESQAAMNTVALIGAGTAVLAAGMGLVANDIKRVLAFSTVSQLGYMFLALGVGAPGVAMFHLFTHAFFKCLLFLGAGSVHHSVHTFDMRYMGGLRRWMPVTYVTTLIGGLSLAGIFPLAGFWSKDEVLTAALEADGGVPTLVLVLGLIAAFMTAFYVARLIILTFHGEFRGGIDAVPMAEREPDEAHHHVHREESPAVMTVPMVALAVMAVGAGLLVNPPVGLGIIPGHWLATFLEDPAPHFNWGIAILSTVLAVGGIALAARMYLPERVAVDLRSRALRVGHRVLSRRYYMDDLYEGFLVRQVFYRGVFFASDWADRRLVDGFVDLIGWLGRNTGRAVAQLQTGQVQVYGVAVSMGVVVLLMLYLFQR